MTNLILGLGLSAELLGQFSRSQGDSIQSALDLREARELLHSTEFCSIIVNASSFQDLTSVLTELMGSTPLTTQIILLSQERQGFDQKALTDMGIKWVRTPVKALELIDRIAH